MMSLMALQTKLSVVIHVFGEIKAENSDEVLKNWENIKQQERYQKEQFSILDNVPIALPSLLRAAKLQKRCAK